MRDFTESLLVTTESGGSEHPGVRFLRHHRVRSTGRRQHAQLAKGVNREEIIEQLRKVGPRLDQEYGVSLIILFGSFASGHVHAGRDLSSDIDIAVYLSANQEGQKGVKQRTKLADYIFDSELSLIGEFTDLLRTDSVDVVMINESPPVLKYEIFTKGIVTYCKDEADYEDQYLAAIREYFDIQPLLRQQFEKAQEYLSTKGSGGTPSWSATHP